MAGIPRKLMQKTILIAEDDRLLRELMQRRLGRDGLTVLTAADGKEAMAMIERAAPDLLLLDLLMPVADGFAVLEHRQKNRGTYPVVVLSNLADPGSLERAERYGITDYLVKGAIEGDLWRRVKTYLQT